MKSRLQLKHYVSMLIGCAAATFAAGAMAARAPAVDQALHDQALEILQKSIAFKTVDGAGQVPAYAEYLKSVLVDAGFAAADITIEPVANTATLVARYRGTDSKKKPLLVIGHMDVVEARREDWERDPFTPVIENGYVFGRGSVDNKFDISMVTATLAKLKRQGWKPKRDVILALSGDEETAMVSTQKLAAQFKHAELVLNGDAGGGLLSEEGEPVVYGLQAGEKSYADYKLTVTNPGGHSSRPTKPNAINQLARALDRIAEYEFPVMRNELTMAYFKQSLPKLSGPIAEAIKAYLADPQDAQAIATLSADPNYVGQLRTTCVATQIEGGHAPNALPQKAVANINCRIFPGVSVEEVQKTLTDIAADPDIAITLPGSGSVVSDASPLRKDVMNAVTKAVHARFPGLSIVPSMSAGATDSMHFRALGVPSYGVSGLFMKDSDEFAHGLNERVPVSAIDGALAHWDSLLKTLARQ
ncbi:M20/M25/M40 family metallo-hydrolase [Steroidobacter sp. S1-65]|uniref:M20/M25/M40 family metallo-hydrolase n=2 Tax=Steroidobacter gossypii TaxID=2805490 RepID=A0ABS1X263_9GAMM|nr:M20/M25/M40 family metallo-hydrolase [Steroidobacter gossypii]MBM0107333.1 M20/M25/M40 family metallo-hydrolase [Steroidobacter gossypii]